MLLLLHVTIVLFQRCIVTTDITVCALFRSCTIPVHILEGLVASKKDSSSSKELLAQWWQQQLLAGSDDSSRSCSTNALASLQSCLTDCVSDTMLPVWQVIPS